MDQFVGTGRTAPGAAATVAGLLVSVAPTRVRAAAIELEASEDALIETDDTATQMRYATALAEYAEAGGYEQEVVWDHCTMAALGIPFERAKWRELGTLSGGEQKRLALEALLRGPEQVLLLDEPDNSLDVPGKRWLEAELRATPKTVLLVSHDRELLARAADRIVTLELGAAGNTAWVHGGSFEGYHEAREERFERLDELRRRWDEQHAALKQLVATLKVKATYNDGMASRYQAAVTRLRKFEEAGPPEERPPAQAVSMRLRGSRTGKRAVVCEGLELTGPDAALRPRGLVRRPGRGARLERLGQVALPAAARGRRHRARPHPRARDDGRRDARPRAARGSRGAGRARRARLVRAEPRASRVPRPHAARHPASRRRQPRRHGARGGELGARPVRARGIRAAALRLAVGRPAGAPADPAARALGRDPAAARRADRQPRPRLGRGARGRALALRRHGARGDARPLVHAQLRPVRGVPLRRRGRRGGCPGVGRGAGGPGAVEPVAEPRRSAFGRVER